MRLGTNILLKYAQMYEHMRAYARYMKLFGNTRTATEAAEGIHMMSHDIGEKC